MYADDQYIRGLIDKAENGDVDTQYLLGVYYANGVFAPLNKEEALKWFIKGANQGNASCQYETAKLLEQLHPNTGSELLQAVDWYAKAARQNHMDAQRRLGIVYEYGLKVCVYRGGPYSSPIYESVLDVHYRNAYAWYKQASEQHDNYSLFRIGILTLNGKGTTKNVKKAFQILLKASCIKSQGAMQKVSELYYEGIGTKKNIKESYIWALIARAYNATLIKEEYVKNLENMLSENEVENAQHEADVRFEKLKKDSLTTEYCLEQAVSSNDAPIYSDEPPTANNAQNDTIEIEREPEMSTNIQFNHIKLCNNYVDLSNVELELLTKTHYPNDFMDFHTLKIIFNTGEGKKTDKKSVTIFQKAPLKITHAERRLLILLAIQFSEPDKSKREENIRMILQSAKPDHASRLNALLKAIFPGCGLPNKNAMLNRLAGTLNIKLKIDTGKLIRAKDIPPL